MSTGYYFCMIEENDNEEEWRWVFFINILLCMYICGVVNINANPYYE